MRRSARRDLETYLAYGGINQLRLRLVVLFVFASGIVVTAALSAVGIIKIWESFVKGVSTVLRILAWLVGLQNLPNGYGYVSCTRIVCLSWYSSYKI